MPFKLEKWLEVGGQVGLVSCWKKLSRQTLFYTALKYPSSQVFKAPLNEEKQTIAHSGYNGGYNEPNPSRIHGYPACPQPT